MQLYAGTSGYAYKEWKGHFYPEKLPADRMLEHYGTRLRTVEVNNTFYRMPSEKAVAQWDAAVPAGFAFTIKASRRITHQARLKDCADPVRFLHERIALLGDKLGCVLYQLPPLLRKDLPLLEEFLKVLPAKTPAAMEFRHLSWYDDEVYEVLRAKNAALCTGDGQVRDGKTKVDPPFASTADWGYLRLRGEAYDAAALDSWATRIREQPWSRAFVYFKHEDEAAGPKLAARFTELWNKTT
jgi:uncharacterized protein YecE (DUF72 family)